MLERDRLRQLVEAGRTLSSELELDVLLQHVVEVAASLTSARRAALGVIDEAGTGLERLVTTGIDGEMDALGGLPELDGVFSPPLLDVSIVLRGATYGHLYLAEKDSAEFTHEDEEVATLLAAQAAVAIENARLYQAARSWAQELEALDRIAAAMAEEHDLEALFSRIVDELRKLTDARIATIWLPTGDGSLELRAVSGEWPERLARMRRSARDSKLARVFERRRSERVDAVLDDAEVDQATARLLGLKTGLWTPLLIRDRAAGVLAAYDKTHPDPRFSQADVRTAERLAAHAAVAVTHHLRAGGAVWPQPAPAAGSLAAR
ncbi:MAG TPA: GAF domain-containing protein [Gaiellaceae bacterium]|nr:GAF domain-containing protein [Gaiellaceae bacterium]